MACVRPLQLRGDGGRRRRRCHQRTHTHTPIQTNTHTHTHLSAILQCFFFVCGLQSSTPPQRQTIKTSCWPQSNIRIRVSSARPSSVAAQTDTSSLALTAVVSRCVQIDKQLRCVFEQRSLYHLLVGGSASLARVRNAPNVDVDLRPIQP